jgi:hypothetical protein
MAQPEQPPVVLSVIQRQLAAITAYLKANVWKEHKQEP